MLAPAIDAPITLHFHPDRRLPDRRSVAEALRDEGVYRNQFETGISNGLLGGDRLRWEHELFAGAYDDAPAEDAEAVVLDPVYAGTEFEAALAATGLPVEWHDGFVLDVAEIPAEPVGEARWQRFCAGGRARAYARRLGPALDAAVIGRAAAAIGYTDELKDLWVMTVMLGRDRPRGR
jgi:hypothetical protein